MEGEDLPGDPQLGKMMWGDIQVPGHRPPRRILSVGLPTTMATMINLSVRPTPWMKCTLVLTPMVPQTRYAGTILSLHIIEGTP